MEYIIPCKGKRRRIVCSDEDNNPTTHPTNTDEQRSRNRAESVASTAATNPESDTDEDEDSLAEEVTQLQNEIILKKLQRANGEGDEVQLLHTSSRAKLFEYVKGNEGNDDEGTWVYRGEGQVKFIRCLEEGYNRGMIRMELTKNCTLEVLMCHEVTHEDVSLFHLIASTSSLTHARTFLLTLTFPSFGIQALPMNSNKGKAYTWICKDWAYNTTKKTFA
jgi:hypothetical protein